MDSGTHRFSAHSSMNRRQIGRELDCVPVGQGRELGRVPLTPRPTRLGKPMTDHADHNEGVGNLAGNKVRMTKLRINKSQANTTAGTRASRRVRLRKWSILPLFAYVKQMCQQAIPTLHMLNACSVERSQGQVEDQIDGHERQHSSD